MIKKREEKAKKECRYPIHQNIARLPRDECLFAIVPMISSIYDSRQYLVFTRSISTRCLIDYYLNINSSPSRLTLVASLSCVRHKMAITHIAAILDALLLALIAIHLKTIIKKVFAFEGALVAAPYSLTRTVSARRPSGPYIRLSHNQPCTGTLFPPQKRAVHMYMFLAFSLSFFATQRERRGRKKPAAPSQLNTGHLHPQSQAGT